MKEIAEWLVPVGIVMLVICLIVAIYRSIGVSELRQQAINQGFAEYNATNGVWQWKSPANLERAK